MNAYARPLTRLWWRIEDRLLMAEARLRIALRRWGRYWMEPLP